MSATTYPAGASIASNRPSPLGRFRETIALWRARARHRSRDRREFAQWLDRDLHDAGISRADVLFELNKPFWRG